MPITSLGPTVLGSSFCIIIDFLMSYLKKSDYDIRKWITMQKLKPRTSRPKICEILRLKNNLVRNEIGCSLEEIKTSKSAQLTHKIFYKFFYIFVCISGTVLPLHVFFHPKINKDARLQMTSRHRWAQLTQKVAPLTANPIIKKISFANANPITQIFR